MKRILVFISAFALSTGISYAQEAAEEEAVVEGEEMAMMDEDMMMEAPAPSVTLTGSGEIGVKMVDDGDDATEDMQIIREYKVAFASSGVTDGGLMFGGGININDTEDNDPHQSVSAANVFVGAADGSWKLQLGGNDPGIEQAGGIGVADDHFGGGKDATIGLSGSFEGATFRMTMANPGASVPARSQTWDRTYKDSGLALPSTFNSDGTTREITVPAPAFTATQIADWLHNTPAHTKNDEAFVAYVTTVLANCGITYKDGNAGTDANDATEDDIAGNKKVDPAGTVANTDTYTAEATNDDRCSNMHLDKNDSVTIVDNYAAVNAAKAKDNNWSIGFSYELNPVTVGVGMDSSKGIALSLGTDLSGVAVTAFYGKSEHEDVMLGRKMDTIIQRRKTPAEFTTADTTGTPVDATTPVDFTAVNDGYTVDLTEIKDIMGTRENTGIGVSASISAGEGATFTVGYSKLDLDQTSTGANADKKYNGSAETTQIDIDFTYDLGGGAMFKAGIDKKEAEMIGAGKKGATSGVITTKDTTTLSASIAMTF